MKLKKSYYNTIVEKLENGDILLFNYYQCSFGILKENMVGIYNNIQNININNLSDLELNNIKIMKENGFLINDDVNEIDLLKISERKAQYSNDIKFLTVAPTMACNMKCPYCFENKNNKNTMSDEVKNNIIDFLKEYLKGAKYFSLAWFGGEPLLGLDIIRALSKEIKQICSKNEIKYSSSIITNGILLNKDVAKVLVEECNVKFAQITLDGLRDTTNARRKLKNGQNSFDIIENNIEQVKHILPISVRINLDKNNKSEVDGLIDYFIKEKKWVKDKNFFFYFAQVENSTENCNIKDGICFTATEFNDLLKEIYNKIYDMGYYDFIFKYVPKVKNTYCSANLYNSYCIDPDGDIYKCLNIFGDKKYSIGNIKNINLQNSNNTYWLANNKPEKCYKCKKFTVCKGGCSYKRLLNGNKPPCSDKIEIDNELLKLIYKHYAKTANN